MALKKIHKFLVANATVSPRASMHIVVGLYLNWFGMVVTAWYGALVTFWYSIACMLFFVLWETYFRLSDKKHFSVTNVMAGIVTILPLTYYVARLL